MDCKANTDIVLHSFPTVHNNFDWMYKAIDYDIHTFPFIFIKTEKEIIVMDF